MKKNLGDTDRMARALIAMLIAVICLTQLISGKLAINSLIIAELFLLSSSLGFCPLYKIIKINSHKH
ncbi:MAG: DUF2892 domain-containing protein [Bacteroidetes bacterium]|nr:DUF2892 domain-containing protein [Bacteroidota bacterium]